MTDKYEEFKKYCNEQADGMEKLFQEFEKEQSEKEKEREIKDTIEQALYEEHCCSNGTTLYANAIYNKLKEKDLIK